MNLYKKKFDIRLIAEVANLSNGEVENIIKSQEKKQAIKNSNS